MNSAPFRPEVVKWVRSDPLLGLRAALPSASRYPKSRIRRDLGKHPWLDTYRTLLVSPSYDLAETLRGVRDVLAA